jgi:hypothetical protein
MAGADVDLVGLAENSCVRCGSRRALIPQPRLAAGRPLSWPAVTVSPKTSTMQISPHRSGSSSRPTIQAENMERPVIAARHCTST